MKLAFALIFLAAPSLFAGDIAAGPTPPAESPPRWELGLESAYLLGAFNNPHSYEVNANFLTTRLRWGDYTERPGFLRGYNQIYLSAEAQPIIRGIENYYFGLNVGLRYNFGRANARVVPYFSGGLGLGWIDSRADNFGSQGQDFTFNILSAAGVSVRIAPRLRGEAGILYEHLSNANQTDPNPSLNLFGPQLGLSYSF